MHMAKLEIYRQILFEKKEFETKAAEFEENLVVSQESLKAMIAKQVDDLERLKQEKKEIEEEILANKLREQPSEPAVEKKGESADGHEITQQM